MHIRVITNTSLILSDFIVEKRFKLNSYLIYLVRLIKMRRGINDKTIALQ